MTGRDVSAQHPDRHAGCGGLWVGGVCDRCEAHCKCRDCDREVYELRLRVAWLERCVRLLACRLNERLPRHE